MLVASYLPKGKRQLYMNPGTKVAVQNDLFNTAWEQRGLRQDVEDALFNQDTLDTITSGQKKSLKDNPNDGKVDSPHLKGKVVRIHSMLRYAGDAGPNYLALVTISNNALAMKASTTTHGTRIWEIAQRLKGAEIYQIRNDLPLLLRQTTTQLDAPHRRNSHRLPPKKGGGASWPASAELCRASKEALRLRRRPARAI